MAASLPSRSYSSLGWAQHTAKTYKYVRVDTQSLLLPLQQIAMVVDSSQQQLQLPLLSESRAISYTVLAASLGFSLLPMPPLPVSGCCRC